MTNKRLSDEVNAGPKRGEALLPDALRRELAPLNSTYQSENVGDGVARVKLFTPRLSGTSWSWYVAEFDGEDIFWGLVKTPGSMPWYTHFRLSELESIRDDEGLRIQRDRHFRPIRLGDLAAALSAREG